MVSVTFSPGHGRHSGTFMSSGLRVFTTGMPLSSTCHTGPASRRQTSVQGSSVGAVSSTLGFGSSTDLHDTSVWAGPMLTKALP